eukprot:667615-Prorocentrum_minimum.AAC.2
MLVITLPVFTTMPDRRAIRVRAGLSEGPVRGGRLQVPPQALWCRPGDVPGKVSDWCPQRVYSLSPSAIGARVLPAIWQGSSHTDTKPL